MGGEDIDMLKCKLPDNKKFRVLIDMSILGIGTIWLGRKWPENSHNYKEPDKAEIDSYLDLAYRSGIRMFDTAAAYGSSEQLLGQYFKEHPEQIREVYIATKWGEDFDINLETSSTNHSVEYLSFSLKRSLRHLPKVDLLYIHKANSDVLRDKAISGKMLQLKQDKIIAYTGASISSENDLEEALNKNCLWVDFVQTSAAVARNKPDILKAVFDKGIAVVVNAPVRNLPTTISPKESYVSLSENPHVSFVLTGTRNHLTETVGHFS